LRRCLYHFIEFPPAEHMTAIVKAHFPDINKRLLESALQKFYEIREDDTLLKKPSTSEILDWIKVLIALEVDEIGEDTPFPETLLKSKEDYDKIVGAVAQQRKKEALKEKSLP